jgi:PPOX class probable F420-dependent enzyme
MRKLSPTEIWKFLMERPRTAKIATVRADGRPHVAPIWFERDGNDLIWTTWHTSIKALNLQRDPRVSLCIDDETPPFAFVIIEGTVSFSDDPEQLRSWATRIGGRYMGIDQAEAYGARNSVEGELLVRITPTKLIGQAEIAA